MSVRSNFIRTMPAVGYERDLPVWVTPEMIEILLDYIPPCFHLGEQHDDSLLVIIDSWNNDERHLVTAGDLTSALHAVAAMPQWSHLRCRKYALDALLNNDPGAIDGELSYVVWQLAVLGSIEYDV